MSPKRNTLLGAARRIGGALCDTAYWHDGQCNWVGRNPREMLGPGLPIVPTVTALGPEVYGGTSGIALFLAQLHVRAPSERIRRTAIGGMRQALRRGKNLPAVVARSFYSGRVGIAYAAARVGTLLAQPELVEVGLQFAREVVTASDENHLLDVIGGNAGAVAPLLWLAETHHCDQLHAQAIELTDELVRTATKRDRTWSWEPERASGKDIGRMPLCGLAHGASGMGLALLEMGVHHRRQDWIDGGLAAFAYEDQLYDSNEQNWPDLRTFDSPTNDGEPAQRAFMVAWCHGAAGIALARLRACQLLPERRSELIAGAERAVCATTGRLQRMPTGSDASPCHGRAGLAEALLCAATILDDRQYADEAINRWLPTVRSHQGATDWPCGVPSGRNNPSLMLGQAGIGYGLLRADNPAAVPSVLLITPPQGFD